MREDIVLVLRRDSQGRLDQQTNLGISVVAGISVRKTAQIEKEKVRESEPNRFQLLQSIAGSNFFSLLTVLVRM
jgi:hypothetical protein